MTSATSNATSTAAADTGERARIAAEIRRMGRTFNEEILKATYALYAPLQEQAPKDGIEVHKDLAYGEDARHRLDVFAPASKPRRAPVVVYFHGGGYVAGTRSPLPGLIYDNVPTFFARNGCIGVNATYRLAPQHRWPAGAADVGAVVAWLRDNAAKYGGDPERIFIMGQSAGATHVATWTFMDAVHGSAGPRVAGALLLSGVYAALHPGYSDGKPMPNQLAYYGEDTSKWDAMSPLGFVKQGHPPVFVAVAEFDPYPLAWPSAALLAALVKCDRSMPRFEVLPDHNHVSPAMQINSAVDTLGPTLLEFVRAAR
jgi:acetyl esterase